MAVYNITGFGKFFGVSDNPTTHIIQNIDANPHLLSNNYQINSTKILHVSAEISKENLYLMSWPEKTTSPRVFLHFGKGIDNKFNIEIQAYNEADFCVPDENGYMPSHSPILSDNSNLNYTLYSSVKVDNLCKELQTNHMVSLSSDPGRFVCNWVYFNSLYRSLNEKTISLFIHVPSFDDIDEENQMNFVYDLLKTLPKYL